MPPPTQTQHPGPSRTKPAQLSVGAEGKGWGPHGVPTIPPELGVVYLDGHRVLRVVGVPQGELEELGSAQRGVDGVARGDGRAQRAGDALCLCALTVGGNDLQVSGVLGMEALLGLQIQGPRGPWSRGSTRLGGCFLATSPSPPQMPDSFGINTTPFLDSGLDGTGRLKPRTWGGATCPGGREGLQTQRSPGQLNAFRL